MKPLPATQMNTLPPSQVPDASSEDPKKRLRVRKGGTPRLRLQTDQTGSSISDGSRNLLAHAQTGLRANARILQGIRKNIMNLRFGSNHENCRRFVENVKTLQETLRAISSDLPELDIRPEAFGTGLALGAIKEQVTFVVDDPLKSKSSRLDLIVRVDAQSDIPPPLVKPEVT
eukprot:scaffold361_cov248-Pinguiococcus_pyrenoidosus.AAC.7